MEYIIAIFGGVIIGFIAAIPTGPVGILCIQRTLTHGQKAGFTAGLGAAFADAFFAIVGAFSITIISHFIFKHHAIFRLIGGLFIIALGALSIWPPKRYQNEENSSPRKRSIDDFISSFLITITNPLTAIAFIAMFAGIGFRANYGDYFSASLLVIGVFFGSALWWLTLSYLTNIFKHKATPHITKIINTVSGWIILVIGAFLVGSVLFRIH